MNLSVYRKPTADRYGTHPIYVRVPVVFTQNATTRFVIPVPGKAYFNRAMAFAATLPAGGTLSFLIRRYDASTPVALTASYNPETGGDLTAGTPKAIPALTSVSAADRLVQPTSTATLEIAAIASDDAIATAGDLVVTVELYLLD